MRPCNRSHPRLSRPHAPTVGPLPFASMMHEADRRPPGNGTAPGGLPPDGLVLRGVRGVSRVRCWPSQPRTAHLLMYQQQRPPTTEDLLGWCEMLAGRGFVTVRTSALGHAAAARVETAGFHVIQELVLLQHDDPGGAPSPAMRTSRLLVSQRREAAAVDRAAFG